MVCYGCGLSAFTSKLCHNSSVSRHYWSPSIGQSAQSPTLPSQALHSSSSFWSDQESNKTEFPFGNISLSTGKGRMKTRMCTLSPGLGLTVVSESFTLQRLDLLCVYPGIMITIFEMSVMLIKKISISACPSHPVHHPVAELCDARNSQGGHKVISILLHCGSNYYSSE